MNRKSMLTMGIAIAVFTVFSVLAAQALSAQDKFSLRVPGGLAFSDFRGYEGWQVVSISHTDKMMSAILGNPKIIAAFRAGVPGNGKPFPDGSKMAKVHWIPKKSETAPGPATVPDTLHDVDFMEKDGKRFADSGGWGYAVFDHDAATDTFSPGTAADHPPQANDAKCGFACHTRVKARDFVFTEYGER